MRKSLIITIAAALLIAAVLCTAGCVENKTADPAVGDWSADENDTLTLFSVYKDGTGAYVTAKAKVLASGETGYVEDEESTFVWVKNADGTYLISFADGDTSTAEVNTQRGILTLDDGRRFEKQASELSGASGLVRNPEGYYEEVEPQDEPEDGPQDEPQDEPQDKPQKTEIETLKDKIKKLEEEIEKLERVEDKDQAMLDKIPELKMDLKSLKKDLRKLEKEMEQAEK